MRYLYSQRYRSIYKVCYGQRYKRVSNSRISNNLLNSQQQKIQRKRGRLDCCKKSSRTILRHLRQDLILTANVLSHLLSIQWSFLFDTKDFNLALSMFNILNSYSYCPVNQSQFELDMYCSLGRPDTLFLSTQSSVVVSWSRS